MSEPTRQEIFDRVAKHLLAQNEAAVCEGVCQYRYNGLSCAVGCLITDEHYDEMLEGSFVGRKPVIDAVANSLGCSPRYVGTRLLELLRCLQVIHDETDPHMWPEHLKKLADKYNLEWNHE